MRRFLTLRWFGVHLLAVALISAFIPLGQWQWRRGGEATGGMQNYGYAFEWWFFAAFCVFMWVRLVRDELKPPEQRIAARRGAAAEQAAGDVSDEAGQVDPRAAAERAREAAAMAELEDPDPELDAYNAYLRRLAERDEPPGVQSSARTHR